MGPHEQDQYLKMLLVMKKQRFEQKNKNKKNNKKTKQNKNKTKKKRIEFPNLK